MGKSSLGATAVSLALAKDAAADTVQSAKTVCEKSETVLVTGIRASLKESLDVKRESQTVDDVVTSEDVGKFPDQDVAEALQCVSGVSISREYGEGERVSIRDTAPNLHRTSTALFSWKNATESVGIMPAGIYQERNIPS